MGARVCVCVCLCVCAAIPDGKVIGMFAFTATGLQKRTQKKLDFATLDDVIINDLGGKLISDVNKGDSYSLLTVKGVPPLVSENARRSLPFTSFPSFIQFNQKNKQTNKKQQQQQKQKHKQYNNPKTNKQTKLYGPFKNYIKNENNSLGTNTSYFVHILGC